MIMRPSLVDALGATDERMVAFVGAGGKTSAILRVASELASLGRTVIVTTTTLVGERLASCAANEVADASDEMTARRIAGRVTANGTVFLHTGRRSDGKFIGAPPELLDLLARLAAADCILIEADGARGLPIKMPARHEPVIPQSSGLVVPMIGMDALGRPIAEGSVHRPGLFAGLGGHERVTSETCIALLTSENGGLRRVPREAAVRPLLNKAGETGGDSAQTIAEEVLRRSRANLDRVVAGSVQQGSLRVYDRRGTEPAASSTERS
jgi:probable selenium-dependent hydroxylase accessory protein YqeC